VALLPSASRWARSRQPAAGLVVTLAEQASAFAGNAMQAIASTSAVGAVAAAAGFTRITIPAAAWNVPVTVQLASPRDINARTAAAGSSLPGRLQVRRRQQLQRGHKLECVPAAAQRARAGDRHGRRGPDAAHLGRHRDGDQPRCCLGATRLQAAVAYTLTIAVDASAATDSGFLEAKSAAVAVSATDYDAAGIALSQVTNKRLAVTRRHHRASV